MDLSNFDNFQQREMSSGIETVSETEYKGYLIRLRCYNYSGISGKIIKVSDSGKRIIVRERAYNFIKPIDFLNELKHYIDNYECNLISNFNRKTKQP